MENDSGAGDPLLRAIAEFRAELNRLIDEQIERLGSPEESPRAEPLDDRSCDAYASPPRLEARTRLGPRTTPAPEPAPAGPPGDPRQRLEALAKRLDGRRRAAGDAGRGREPIPTGEPGGA